MFQKRTNPNAVGSVRAMKRVVVGFLYAVSVFAAACGDSAHAPRHTDSNPDEDESETDQEPASLPWRFRIRESASSEASAGSLASDLCVFRGGCCDEQRIRDARQPGTSAWIEHCSKALVEATNKAAPRLERWKQWCEDDG